jgi:hypothetical protein
MPAREKISDQIEKINAAVLEGRRRQRVAITRFCGFVPGIWILL